MNVPRLPREHKIEALDQIHGHGLLPGLEILGPVHGQPLLHLTQFSHTRIAHRIGTMIGLEHRSVDRAVDRFGHRPGNETPDQHVDLHLFGLQLQPLAVEAIAVWVVRVHIQYIDVDQVGFVDRGRPGSCVGKAHGDGGGAGKQTAHHVQTFVRLDMGLVPGHGSGERLVRVDHQPGGAVRTAGRAHGYGIRSHRLLIDGYATGFGDGAGPLFSQQLRDGALEAVKQDMPEHVSRDHVFAGQGQNVQLHRVGVFQGILGNARSIGFDVGAGSGLQVSFVAGVKVVPQPQPMHQVVLLGGVGPVDAPCNAPVVGNRALYDLPGVLGHRVAKSKRGVGIRLAHDVGHTPDIALYLCFPGRQPGTAQQQGTDQRDQNKWLGHTGSPCIIQV